MDAGYLRSRCLDTNRYLLEHGRANVQQTIYQDDCVVLPPVFIHPDARLSTSIIGPFASIGAGAVIQNSSIRDSILSPGVHITNTHLEGSILGHDVVITGMMGKFNLGDNSWVSW